MSNFKKIDYILEYPEKEKALGFIPEEAVPFKSAVIGVTYPFPGYSIESEVYSIVGIEYVAKGEGEVFVDDEWRRVSAGDIFVLREGEAHKYRAAKHDPWHKLWILYRAEYLGPFLDAYGIKTGVYHAPDARVHFERAEELSNAPDNFSDLCYSLAECVHNIATIISESAKREEGGEHRRIRDALDVSIYKKAELDTIADTLHMSKSNMIRIFKKHYGTTPYDYLLTRKIEVAKLLLSGTNMSVREIADKLCILDEHYFSTLFLKRVGVRPRDFRRGK